jgi:hypothetical protein
LNRNLIYKILNGIIASIWLTNGLFCKVLHLVPRHEKIVAGILGDEHSALLTMLIGISEILMAIWILIGIKRRLNAIVQMLVIATMNTIEFLLVPDLLLWGRWNLLFALLLIVVIYYTEFILLKRSKVKA